MYYVIRFGLPAAEYGTILFCSSEAHYIVNFLGSVVLALIFMLAIGFGLIHMKTPEDSRNLTRELFYSKDRTMTKGYLLSYLYGFLAVVFIEALHQTVCCIVSSS